MPNYTPDDQGILQSQLNSDPQYLSLKSKFTQSQSPLDWLALTQYSSNKLDLGNAANRGRYAATIGGSGNVQVSDPNNPWTSPGTWGPVIVGAAAAPFALGYGAANSAAASAAGAGATGSTVPVTGALVPATSGAIGATGTGANMASIFTNPNVISAGIGGGFQYAGGKQQANANQQAAQLQYKATEEALADARAQRAWQQQQYQNYQNQFSAYQQRMQPFLDTATQQNRMLGQLLARSPYAQYAATGQAPAPQQFTLPQSSIGNLIAKS